MNQELLERMKDYSDVRIMNTIKQAKSFDPEIVEVAKHLAAEKGLTSPETMHLYEQREKFLKMAKQQIKQGTDAELIKKSLMDQGAPEDFAKEVLTEAARSVTLGMDEKKGESSGMSIWTILFIIFVVVRIVLRMVRN